MFYFILFLLILASMAIVWLAFKSRESNPKQLMQQRLKRHVELFKNNTQQLEFEKSDGLISEADFNALYNDQARDLIETVEHLENIDHSPASLNGFVLLTLLSIPLLSVALYYSKGGYPDYLINEELQQLSSFESEEQYTSTLADIKVAIEHRVEQRPDNVEYRLLLAQLAMSNQNYAEALSHYSIIAELLPEDAQAQAYYAQALYLANNRTLDSRVAAALDKTLQLDPFQVTALGMVGILAFESGDFQGAVDAWQKLMAVTDPASARGQMIQKGLAQAQQKLSSQGVVSKIDNGKADNNDADTPQGISVALSIDESLLHSLEQNYTVFVYAKAETGPAMPLAAQRISVSDLPVVVLLDDSTAMTPHFKLSKFDRVVIGARISKTGTAIAQEGDITVELDGFDWRKNADKVIVLAP